MLALIHSIILIGTQARSLLLAQMLEAAEEVRRPSIQILRLSKLIEAKAAHEQIARLAHQMHAFSDVVNHADVAVVVGLVDVRQLEGGAGVAAVQDDEERGAGRHAGDEVLVQRVGVDLAVAPEVDGTDGVQDAGGAVPGGIPDLAAVAGVVEEVACSGLGDQPVHCCLGRYVYVSKVRTIENEQDYQHVVTTGIVSSAHIVS